MPWQESSPMSERLKFVQACLDRREAIVAICDRFGISEKTGHKYLRRFREAGVDGLADRSHAPHCQPHRMSATAEARIVDLRQRYVDVLVELGERYAERGDRTAAASCLRQAQALTEDELPRVTEALGRLTMPLPAEPA